MASKLISFRLSEQALEALSKYVLPGESDSLTAQRLVLELLGLSTGVNSTVDSYSNEPVDSVVNRIVNSDIFQQKLEEKLASLVNSVNGMLTEQNQRIETLEKQPA